MPDLDRGAGSWAGPAGYLSHQRVTGIELRAQCCVSRLARAVVSSEVVIPSLPSCRKRDDVSQSHERLHSPLRVLQEVIRRAPSARLTEDHDCRSTEFENGLSIPSGEWPVQRVHLLNAADREGTDFNKSEAAEVLTRLGQSPGDLDYIACYWTTL